MCGKGQRHICWQVLNRLLSEGSVQPQTANNQRDRLFAALARKRSAVGEKRIACRF